MSLNNPSVAIVGATGAVGTELIACLEQRDFPLRSLRLFASPRSAGRRLMFRGDGVPVETLNQGAQAGDAQVGDVLAGSDIVLFSAGSGTARRFVPTAVGHGAVVVDNSSAFRMDAGVPLVVPEVNAGAIASHRGIIANPNCVAIIAAVPLWPLHRAIGISRVIAATYQAASGAGAAAMAELRSATGAYLAGRDFTPSGAAPPVCLQPVQPRHRGGPRNRRQRRGDQGGARAAQDHAGAAPADRHHLHPRAGAAGALDRTDGRTGAADPARGGAGDSGGGPGGADRR